MILPVSEHSKKHPYQLAVMHFLASDPSLSALFGCACVLDSNAQAALVPCAKHSLSASRSWCENIALADGKHPAQTQIVFALVRIDFVIPRYSRYSSA